MNPLHDILSSIDPAAARILSATPPVQRLASGSPKPAQRPVKPANGTSQAPVLKRKASGTADGAQTKIARKDAPAPASPSNGAVRTGSPAMGAKPASATSTTASITAMPYRGTAGLNTAKLATPLVKKPAVPGAGQKAAGRAGAPAQKPTVPRPAVATPGATTAPAKKPGGYLALLQKAKEKDATKPATAPIKHEPTKIMTKKDREQARLAAKAASKGKKPVVGPTGRVADAKVDAAKEKRKPITLGYQGTARPATKPVESGYKGTARPASAAPAARAGAALSKKRPQPGKARHDGYAAWSDLSDMEDEEDDYASDGSSDMEGGIWDLEKEEIATLKAAKQEDAAALAEENELKRQKEERKRKLLAMSKAAAAKRKY